MTTSARLDSSTPARRTLIVGVLTAVMIVAGMTAANAAVGTEYEVTFAEERPVEGEHYHTVQAGEFLSSIATDYGLDRNGGWQVLFDANDEIDDPDVIFPGQEILIPEEGTTLERRSAPDSAEASASNETETSRSTESRSSRTSTTQSETTESSSTSEPEQSEPESSGDSGGSSSTSSSSTSSASVDGSVWDRLAECESNGDWSINTGNGYYGGLQFNKSSWDWAGGQQYAEYPHHASRGQQIAVAERLLEIHPAGWGAWPACSSMLGLR
jgi:hypothetical protein